MEENVVKAVAIVGGALGIAQAKGELGFGDEEFSVALGPMLQMGERAIRHNLIFTSDPTTLATVALALIMRLNEEYGSGEEEKSDPLDDFLLEIHAAGRN
jgi:hypothetical protein